jgi:cytochrome c551/c552
VNAPPAPADRNPEVSLKSTRTIALALALATALGGLATGCARKDSSGSAASSQKAATFAADDGPVDHEAAEAGEKLFAGKACSGCHAFGRRITGPDLAGVTRRRSREWMTNQIRHPEVMTKQDPVARELFATYMVQMPNLNLTDDEAHALVEYFKSRDAESGKEH